MRYSLLLEWTPVAGRVVFILAGQGPETVQIVSVRTARAWVRDLERTRLACKGVGVDAELHLEHVVAALASGSTRGAYFGRPGTDAFATAATHEEVGCASDGFERVLVAEEKLCAYDRKAAAAAHAGSEAPWLLALTASMLGTCMNWTEEALAVAPLNAELADHLAMQPEAAAKYRTRLRVKAVASGHFQQAND